MASEVSPSNELCLRGRPRTPFYVTGQVAGQPFSVHAEGERVFMTRAVQPRQEVELVGPEATCEAPAEAKRPDPVCPYGAPAGGEVPPHPAPGVSWHESSETSSGGGI